MSASPVTNVSDTARWVAYYRAMETERSDAHFRDPWARQLAGPQGEAIVNHMPKGRALAWPMIVRTAVLDELILRVITEDRVDTVLNLAAGLDTRAYRLTFPRPIRWFDVDLPEILTYRDETLAGAKPNCTHESVHIDLTDPMRRQALFGRVNAVGKKILVIAEGLLIYLPTRDVASLAKDLSDHEFDFWLIDLAAPALLKRLAKTWGKRLEEARTPFQFAPAEGTAFFEPHGWKEVEYRSLFHDSIRLRRSMRFAKFWLLVSRFAPKKKQEEFRRMSGVVLLERANTGS